MMVQDLLKIKKNEYYTMKNIVIAAEYATRLGELTKNFPKPLLKIGNSTILGRILDDIDKIDDIDEHVIITNHKFAPIQILSSIKIDFEQFIISRSLL